MDFRNYRYKKVDLEFFCPLCGTHRAIPRSHKLRLINYAQIFFISLCFIYFLFPLMGVKSFFIFFVVWMSFETFFRLYFRKEVPCPHCGFDATWYKKDVKVARRLVEDFWRVKEAQKNEEEDALIDDNMTHQAFNSEEENRDIQY